LLEAPINMKILLFLSFLSAKTWANPYLVKHTYSDTYLKVEVLEDRGLHFEISKNPEKGRIWTSPMIFTNPDLSAKNDDFELSFDKDHLCVTIKDLKQNWTFLTTCGHNFDQTWKGLAFFTNGNLNAYGLGAYFQNPGTADGDWAGRVWDPLSGTMGNALRSFSKGAQSYSMFPALYVQGDGPKNYLIFYDSVYKQMWNLSSSPWKVESYGDEIRWYVFTSENVKKLRQKYMTLTGKPPVPPKAAFGMWLSEFGFDDWKEVFEEIESMKSNQLPVSGVALDLQWFGAEFYSGNVDRSRSRFGTLSFDESRFPEPKKTISKLHDEGIEVMVIEESYISQWLNEFTLLKNKNYLARNCYDGSPSILTANPWWGIGGMIDWTNPDAGLFWHNLKRQKLYELGISYHWTDLGEPEMYNQDSCYFGFPELNKTQHADVHNIYNFRWIESIATGYKANANKKRPFMLSRSGTSGQQRFGAAMWSGDIGANMGALTAHYNVQMHMSYSGIDYYGADVGGFHRRPETLDGDQNELYTQWFANASLFDFPVRAHTWNLSNSLETSPSKIGDLESNRYNLILRYKLLPYYYSLAHMAHQDGLPVIIPMPMEFPEDLNVRRIGNQKMIGPFLMGAMVARYGETMRDVYLPKGEWMNWHTHEIYHSRGENFRDIEVVENGIFRIPLFVRKGAIIPSSDEVFIYPSEEKTSFTLFEDDGWSTDYQSGKLIKTVITQQIRNGQVVVEIVPKRDLRIHLLK